jgi:hypothetical protein
MLRALGRHRRRHLQVRCIKSSQLCDFLLVIHNFRVSSEILHPSFPIVSMNLTFDASVALADTHAGAEQISWSPTRSIGMERAPSRRHLQSQSQSQSQSQLQSQSPVVDSRLNVPPADRDRKCRSSVGGKGGGGRASITHSPATSPFLPSTPWQSPVLPGDSSSSSGYSYAVMGVVSSPTSPGGGGGGGGAVPSGALSLLLTCGEFSLRACALLIPAAVHAQCTCVSAVCAQWVHSVCAVCAQWVCAVCACAVHA